MHKIILPTTNPTAGIDHHQIRLLEKLQQYVKAKKPEGSLPFDSIDGLCSGLVAFWLYSIRACEEYEFIGDLEYALNWDENAFKTNGKTDDYRLERFINNVAFLQHDIKLREAKNIKQDNLAASMEFLTGKGYDKVKPCEFKINFVFNHDSLVQLIKDAVFENKMIRLDNSLHTIGLIYSGGKYRLYNPNSKIGPKSFDNPQELAKGIFAALGEWCKSRDYLALSLAAFDFEYKADDKIPVRYPIPLQYCRNLIKTPKYKHAVLQHNNIFHVGARFDDYAMLDLLYDNGYKYIPWALGKTSELEEAILCNNDTKFNYLLQHNFPVNYKCNGGITPLATAIKKGNNNMLYALLVAGANPNIAANDKYSLLDVARVFDNSAAIIMLLAAGTELKTDDLRKLAKKYTTDQLRAIIAHALLLHAKFTVLAQNMSLQLLQTLDEIIQQITSKPLAAHSDKDLRQIEIIRNTLDEILATESDVSVRALAAKTTIDKYFDKYNYRPNKLLFSAPKTIPGQLSYTQDVLPLLSLTL